MEPTKRRRAPVTKQDIQYRNGYARENYDKFMLIARKGSGTFDRIRAYAKKAGMSTTQFILKAAEEKIDRMEEASGE